MKTRRLNSFRYLAAIAFLFACVCMCIFTLNVSTAFANEQLKTNDTAPTEEEALQAIEPQMATGDVPLSDILDEEKTAAQDTMTNVANEKPAESSPAVSSEDEASLAAMASSSTETANMFRMYNPNSGEHFYTASAYERDHLKSVGWNYEGIGWVAPLRSNTPVYRLYNPNAGDHHYTVSAYERDELVKAGWNDEGIGWYSDDSMRTAVLRQYNPNAKTGAHNFTVSRSENDMLVGVGWHEEGIGWYAVSIADPKIAKSKIYLDAGHGMGSSTKNVYDSGACGCGYEEAQLTAELVTLTAKYARDLYGLDVYSNVGTNIEYWNRQADAKNHGCTSLVSIHFNASNGGATGTESFIHNKNAAPGASKLQAIMHEALVDSFGLRDRGMKSAGLAVCSGVSTGLPGTLLEICFIDNSYDMKQYQAKKDTIARGLAAGLYEAAQNGF